MYKVRIKYEKQGKLAYISHLDLMKALQRAFLRAEIPVKYSQGFNPHINMSILAPLSTGHGSICELCDLELTCGEMPEKLEERLNAVLPDGLKVSGAWEPQGKPAEIAYCAYDIIYFCGIGEEAGEAFRAPIIIEKKSKRGSQQVDIFDYIQKISFDAAPEGTICRCVLKAGNDTLNPAYVTAALMQKGILDSDAPAKYTRTHIFDKNYKDFV
jgi:radical SAM-linked protein